jgi:hypothetical protein
MFFKLDMLPFRPIEEDVQTALYRSFRDIGLDFKKDPLTFPEAKRVLITFLSDSCPLADTLAVRLGFGGMKAVQDMNGQPAGVGGGFMGTYQRNKMTAIGLLLKGEKSMVTGERWRERW